MGRWEDSIMRLIRFALAISLLFGSGYSFAQPAQQAQQGQAGRGGGEQAEALEFVDQNIATYTSKEDLFAIHAPCEFQIREITWQSEYENTLPGRVYSCMKDGGTYSVTVINYTDVEKIHQARQHTEAATAVVYWRIDLHASIDYAATKLRQEAAKVTFDAWHYIDLIPGHQLQYTMADGTRTFAAIYLHDYRLYIIKANVPPNVPPPGLFQQSLSVIRPDGTRIRYRTLYQHPW
jgi:hypothetical protein